MRRSNARLASVHVLSTAPKAARILSILGLALLACGPLAHATTVTFAEFTVGSTNVGPGGITAGPDGNLWFTEVEAGQIGVLTTAGTLKKAIAIDNGLETELPAGITTGPDGNIWFAEAEANKIGRLTPAGTLTEFDVPTADAEPADIKVGPDGALWFTEFSAGNIGRITTQGTIHEYPIGDGVSTAGIARGADGNMWFAEIGNNRIGRITPQGVFKDFPIPTGSSGPVVITAGPDGNLWFTELSASKVGRITTAGAVTEFPTPSGSAEPLGITAGPDGNLWFVEAHTGKLASITTGGTIAEYSIPSGATGMPAAITVGPDGNLWFTELGNGKIGRATLSNVNTAPCVANATSLCISDQPNDKRFQLTATFSTAQSGGRSGSGEAIPLTSLGVTEGGLFWFFDATNPEMLLKVIDACAVNQHFWVFYAATTNVGFTLTVRDTHSGLSKTYSNQDGSAAAPIQDTSAFACTAKDTADEAPETALSAPVVDDGSASALAAAAAPEPATAAACTASSTNLCIDGRFSIKAHFHTSQGGGSTGSGTAISLTSLGVAQGGLFWFFDANNPEMLVKVINACALNNKYWVFYAAGTNVGFTVTVTDEQTGNSKVYTNADGTAAPPVQDTSALPCPSGA